jgi:UDP-N-acetylglucosamine 2-epimerase (non-hydrolysing)
MSKLFIELDRKFNHILIHTGQHYDKILSDVFFEELNIRKPDYNLRIGSHNNKHYQQISFLAVRFIKLLKLKKINPDLIIFLGDSNSVALSFFLKKEGYKIGHIESGMRSYDKRMFEEINRTICDHCSDFLFVYHKDYKKNLELENIRKNVYVVGNTIV